VRCNFGNITVGIQSGSASQNAMQVRICAYALYQGCGLSSLLRRCGSQEVAVQACMQTCSSTMGATAVLGSRYGHIT
jgi:hypothetical protein